MVIKKDYAFIVPSEDGQNLDAYNKLEAITSDMADWEYFVKLEPEGTRELMLDIINQLLMPYTDPTRAKK